MDDHNQREDSARRGSPYLNTAQAALFLRMSERSLRRLRALGTGPRVRRHTRRAIYHIEDLEAWSRTRADTRSDGDEG